MQQAAPPPSRPPGASHIRSRRSFAPFAVSQKDLMAVLEAAASSNGGNVQAPPVLQAFPGRTAAPVPVAKRQEASILALHDQESQREAVPRLSTQDHAREGCSELSALVSSLQQNIQGLTASNQREKATSEHVKRQLQSLTAELAKARELYDEEKAKNEKITAMRKNQKNASGDYGIFLPDIHSAAAAAAAAAALQQQAQLELTYQRKILSLENRYKDLMENNKRLLRKIEQLEKTEKDADAIIDNLRQENVRLGTQNDDLSSTVASQSSLIIGLRTSLQKLHQDEHQIGSLMKKFDRSQIELEATKVREKLLRDDHDRLKVIMGKEKEALMAKIMDFQLRLQQSTLASDDLEALNDRIRRLETDKRVVVDEMVVLREQVSKAEERMHDQEQMTNRLLLENETLQSDKRDLIDSLRCVEGKLDIKVSLESNLAVLNDREREIEQLMLRNVDLQQEIDTSNQLNAKWRDEIDILKRTQLSHDETVRALQLARQRAATHEALALVEEEKHKLEAQYYQDQVKWDAERAELKCRVHDLENDRIEKEKQIEELLNEVAAHKACPPEQVIVEIKARPSTAENGLRERVEADIERLRAEYGDLQETFAAMEKEYNKLITKKYKTESFQSQVKLLQIENNELTNRLEDLLREQERNRTELHARATEIVELQSRVIDPNTIDMLRKTQESLEKTVSSLVEAEIASESTFTCLQCMRLFVSPMTLTPCGHTYCASCMDGMGDVAIPSSIVCKECSPARRQESESVFPNQALADLTARFIFRQQTLSSLTTMCLSLRNSFADRARS